MLFSIPSLHHHSNAQLDLESDVEVLPRTVEPFVLVWPSTNRSPLCVHCLARQHLEVMPQRRLQHGDPHSTPSRGGGLVVFGGENHHQMQVSEASCGDHLS